MKSIVPGVQMLARAGLRRPEGARPPGPVVGRLPDALHHHADADVPRRDGRRAGREHDQRVRWHPLGLGHRARRSSTSRPRAASAARIWQCPMRYIENSPLFWARPRHDAAAHHEQRRRRRGALVPGHRDVRRHAPARQGGVPASTTTTTCTTRRSRANQKDIAMRMQQFFDNKLKGQRRRRTGWCTAFRTWRRGEISWRAGAGGTTDTRLQKRVTLSTAGRRGLRS